MNFNAGQDYIASANEGTNYKKCLFYETKVNKGSTGLKLEGFKDIFKTSQKSVTRL